MKVLKSFKVEWKVYYHLYKKYVAGKSKEQKSILNDKITSVREQIKNLVELLKSCIALNPPKKAAWVILSDIPQKGFHCKGYYDKMWTIESSNYRWFFTEVAKTSIGQQKETLTSEFKIDGERNLRFTPAFHGVRFLSFLLKKEHLATRGKELSFSQLQEAVKVITSNIVTTIFKLTFPYSKIAIEQLTKLFCVIQSTKCW